MITPQGASSFLQEFQAPANTFRPWPLFTLNDEYEPGLGEARLTELLEGMARVGFGGVFLHPRPGLITEYLSPRWFEIVRHCVRECIRLGLVPALYDENSYPSGFGGGHVLARAPEIGVRFIVPRFGALPARPPFGALTVYRVENGIPTERIASEALCGEEAWCAFVVERMQPLSWHGELPYPSILDPKTAPIFLETTYTRYRDELGPENWSACAAFFTDEPHLPTSSHGLWGEGLHFSPIVQIEFHRRRGYRIEHQLADLYYNSPTSSATRFDFYEVLHELWIENYTRPTQAWCRENGIPQTGHYFEHDWPCPYATPGAMHLLAQMDWPGTDLLEAFLLEGHAHQDPQNLKPAPAGIEPQALYFLKQVQSVANQLGKKRVMNESWGAGGHDSGPLDWLRIGRFLAVHGVNLFVPHYATTTIRGARKKDHPQFFSDQSPWFENLKPLNDELGRLSWLTSRGRTRQRVLVLDSTTTGYCLAAKHDCLSKSTGHDLVAAPFETEADTQRSIRPLREIATEFVQSLSDAQVDFDLGDEYVLSESASIDGQVLRVGTQAYDVIVLPPGLRNLKSSTLSLLKKFLVAGGTIFGILPVDPLLDGRPAHWPSEIDVLWKEDSERLLFALLEACPPRIHFAATMPQGLAHQRRECEEGVYYLIVNSSSVDWKSQVTVLEEGTLHLLDAQSGRVHPLEGELYLPATSAQIILVSKASLPGSSALVLKSPLPEASGLRLELLSARALEPNVLVLDTCRLATRDERFGSMLVYEANRHYWLGNGMETNGWTNVIQYRDQMVSSNRRMTDGSGCVVIYHVEIESGSILAEIDFAFECPDQWTLSVNDKPVDTSSLPSWLDWRIGRVRIGHLLHEGLNEISLSTARFDVRQEIDQVYLLGDFSVRASNPSFLLGPPKGSIQVGSWKDEGLPFYDRRMAYQFRRPTGSGRLVLQPGDWHGSALHMRCGALDLHTYGPGLDIVIDEHESLDISIVITGLPCNLLGPWHKPHLGTKQGWSTSWHGGDVPNDPQPGAAYRHIDLGLFREPTWFEEAKLM